MARYDHLTLFRDVYALCLDIYRLSRGFQKEYKYTLGEKLKETAHLMIDKVIETNSLENSQKGKPLAELNLVLERLRIYLRLSCDLKVISPGALGLFAEKLENIGNQIGGWKKWLGGACRK